MVSWAVAYLAGYNDYKPDMRETCANYFMRCLRKYVEDCMAVGITRVYFFALDEQFTIDTGLYYEEQVNPPHEREYRREFNSCLRGLQKRYVDVVRVLDSNEWREAFRHGEQTADQYHNSVEEQTEIGRLACELIMNSLHTDHDRDTNVLMFVDSTLRKVQGYQEINDCWDGAGNSIRSLVVPGASICRKSKNFLSIIPHIFGDPALVEDLWESCNPWRFRKNWNHEHYRNWQVSPLIEHSGYYWPDNELHQQEWDGAVQRPPPVRPQLVRSNFESYAAPLERYSPSRRRSSSRRRSASARRKSILYTPRERG
jgi:hypothetical protein